MIWLIIAIITILIIYIWLKPYFLHYHTTLLITGELGAGKTMEGVKTAVRQYKKIRLKIKIRNWFNKQINKISRKHNQIVGKKINKGKKHTGKYWHIRTMQPIPKLVSNIPIRIKGGRHEEWSNVLEKEMLTMERIHDTIKKIPEYSILITDEFPQIVDQYNWNLQEIQENLNELITFFRHYVNGLWIMTAQADSQVVKQMRDKMNQYYWLMNFKRFLFFFYKFDVLQLTSSDKVSNITEGFIEDNMKTRYGILKKGLYDTRCYSERYTTLPEYKGWKRWKKYKTNKIIRFDNYISPLDKQKENE